MTGNDRRPRPLTLAVALLAVLAGVRAPADGPDEGKRARCSSATSTVGPRASTSASTRTSATPSSRPTSRAASGPAGACPTPNSPARPTRRASGCSLSLGGWGWDEEFAAIVADPEAEDRYVEAVLKLVDESDYDGIDLDWEYPDTEREVEGFERLVRRFRAGPRRDRRAEGPARWC